MKRVSQQVAYIPGYLKYVFNDIAITRVRDRVINTLENISADHMDIVADLARSLITSGIDKENVIHIIEKISKLPPEYRVDIVNLGRSLIKGDLRFLIKNNMENIVGIAQQASGLSLENVNYAIELVRDILKTSSLKDVLNEWAGNNSNRQIAATRILDCIRNRNLNLALSALNLTSLPEVFDYPELKHLQEFNLYSNRLTALPESLGSLINLQYLYLQGNRLTALPESLGSLINLQYLYVQGNQHPYLQGNQLTALPAFFGQLTNLRSLDLQGNQLTALPESFGQLTALRNFYLSNNPLRELPSSLRALNPIITDIPFATEVSGTLNRTKVFMLDSEDFQKVPINLLLNLYDMILKNNRVLPKINYIGSIGIDAGGLTRDFITKLFQSLCREDSKLPIKNDDRGLLLTIDDRNTSLPREDQIRCLKAIGTIFGSILFNKAFTTGLYFHPVMFEMLNSLSLEEIEAITVEHIDASKINPKTLQKLLTPLLMALYPAQFPCALELETAFVQNVKLETLGSNIEEFLADYPEVTNLALAVAVIAKAMTEQLGSDYSQTIPRTCQELSEIIQGTEISKEAVLTSLGAGEHTEQLKRWVNQSTPEELKQFIFSISGSITLQHGSSLTVRLYEASELENGAFRFHTCSKTLDIIRGQTDAEFKERLDASIAGSDFNRR